MSSYIVICAGCGQGYVARKRTVNGHCRNCKKVAGYAAMQRAREKARGQPGGSEPGGGAECENFDGGE